MLSFEDTVKQTIKETIKNVFEDEEVVESLFQYFHKASSNAIDEIQVLTDSLTKILGPGSIIIEDLILETLYSKYNLDFEWKKEYRFADYFIELKKQTTRRTVQKTSANPPLDIQVNC